MGRRTESSRTERRPGLVLLTGVVALVSIAAILAIAEIALRIAQGQPLNRWKLDFSPPIVAPVARSLESVAAELTVDSELDPSWIDMEPPPREGRHPEEWRKIENLKARATAALYPPRNTRQWNAHWVRYWGCRGSEFIRTLPEPIMMFDSPGTAAHPIYRNFLSYDSPTGLSTNRFGWRGGPIPLNKPPSTIRLAFVGASTTVGHPGYVYSYPEYVIHWLNVWSENRGLGVRFDGINAGRSGITSESIAAIVKTELMPMEPDLVFYYEGANQFHLKPLLDRKLPDKEEFEARLIRDWRRDLAQLEPYSILVRQIADQIDRLRSWGGREPTKPEYLLDWPYGVDEMAPDLDHPELPVNLSTIVGDLRKIREDARAGGAELGIGSFVWLAYDGLRLDPVRHSWFLHFFDRTYWPFRYADIRRFADFQNRVFRRFAEENDAAYVELAEAFPSETEWFIDGIHFSADGTRLQAWLVLQGLLPTIRERIRAGEWPRADKQFLIEHPHIREPWPMESPCDRLDEDW